MCQVSKAAWPRKTGAVVPDNALHQHSGVTTSSMVAAAGLSCRVSLYVLLLGCRIPSSRAFGSMHCALWCIACLAWVLQGMFLFSNATLRPAGQLRNSS